MLPLEVVLVIEVGLGAVVIWLFTRCGARRRSGRRCYLRRRGLTERCYWHGRRVVTATDVWAWTLVLLGVALGAWTLLFGGTDWDPLALMS